MSFEIRPMKEFLVRPAVPQQLERMSELAYNVLWSWHPTVRSLFRRLDPKLWAESGQNPVLMLGEVPQDALEKAAADPRYQALTAVPASATTPTCSVPPPIPTTCRSPTSPWSTAW